MLTVISNVIIFLAFFSFVFLWTVRWRVRRFSRFLFVLFTPILVIHLSRCDNATTHYYN